MASPSSRTEESLARFFTAADALFISEGYKGASIRKISARAGTSLAILHRQWPNKEALFAELFARHFDPIHADQSAAMQPLEARVAAGSAISPREVLDAFFEPAFRRSAGRGIASRVYCNALTDPSPEVKHIVARLIGDTRGRMLALLRASLPGMDDNRFFVAANLVFGGFVFPQVFGHQLAVAMDYDETRREIAAFLDTLVAMICQGIAAPVTGG